MNEEYDVPLVDELAAEIQAAMKRREQITLDALRMLKTALTMKCVEKGRDLDDAESVQVVNALVKQRRDSIEQFRHAGRQELADKEAAEILVLERYLPAAATPDEIAAAVDAAIEETGATNLKDIGRVMKASLPRLAGKNVDGKAVNEAVRRKLS
jgi:uncharacterized protein